MGHDHAHGLAAKGIRTAFFLNLGFTLLEIAGGFWTNSVAILTDALHDGGDCFSLGLAWYLQHLSAKEADARFTYGYRRFSVMGALVMGLVLSAGVAVMAWKAIERLRHPEEVFAPGMIVLAVVGILANGAAVWRTRGGKSLNLRMVSWHLLEDALGWAAVLLGSIAMSLWHVPILDPLLSLAIGLFVLWNVARNLRTVVTVLLQRTPHGFDAARFAERMRARPGVVSTHHTHTWSLDGEHHVLTTHLVVRPETTRAEINTLKQSVRAEMMGEEFEHVTIDVEVEGEECSGCHGESAASAREEKPQSGRERRS